MFVAEIVMKSENETGITERMEAKQVRMSTQGTAKKEVAVQDEKNVTIHRQSESAQHNISPNVTERAWD